MFIYFRMFILSCAVPQAALQDRGTLYIGLFLLLLRWYSVTWQYTSYLPKCCRKVMPEAMIKILFKNISGWGFAWGKIFFCHRGQLITSVRSMTSIVERFGLGFFFKQLCSHVQKKNPAAYELAACHSCNVTPLAAYGPETCSVTGYKSFGCSIMPAAFF